MQPETYLAEIADLMSDDLIRFIPLTQGEIAVVDRWAYDALVARGLWDAGTGYASKNIKGEDRRQHMHREVLILAGHDITGFQVDHANMDKLDNRLCNLRPGTREQNDANKPSRGGTSKYKGVCRNWRRWRARYRLYGREVWIGYYDTEEEAARAYDAKMFELFGDWARLNFPLKLPYETGGPPIVTRPPFDSLPRVRQ